MIMRRFVWGWHQDYKKLIFEFNSRRIDDMLSKIPIDTHEKHITFGEIKQQHTKLEIPPTRHHKISQSDFNLLRKYFSF